MIVAGIGDDMRRLAMLGGATVLAIVTTGGGPAGTKPLGEPLTPTTRCGVEEAYELADDAEGPPTPRRAAIEHLEGRDPDRWRRKASAILLAAILDGTAVEDRHAYTTTSGGVSVSVSEVARGFRVSSFSYPAPC